MPSHGHGQERPFRNVERFIAMVTTTDLVYAWILIYANYAVLARSDQKMIIETFL